MMLRLGAMGTVGVLWILYGINVSNTTAGPDNLIPGVLGNPFSDFGLTALASGNNPNDSVLPVFYAATVAIATVALVPGAFADTALTDAQGRVANCGHQTVLAVQNFPGLGRTFMVTCHVLRRGRNASDNPNNHE